MPLFTYGRLLINKTPAVVTLCLGGLNVILVVVLSGPAHLGLYGITIAGAVSLILKNAVFTPLYVSHITGFQKTAFYKGMFTLAAYLPGLSAGVSGCFHRLTAVPIATGLAVCMSYAAFAFSSFVRKKKGGLLYRNAEK